MTDIRQNPIPAARESVRFRPARSRVVRLLLLAIGWLAVVLGFVGIFLPLLPTTPFLLLAAACFLRSSPRFYRWLLGHRRLGPYIIYYLDGQGMPYRAKLYTLAFLWSTLAFSSWLLGIWWLTVLLLISGTCGSLYIRALPVRKPDESAALRDDTGGPP